MSTSVATLLATLSVRIRDPYLMTLATAYPPDAPSGSPLYSPSGVAFAEQILSDAQVAVNMLEKNVLARVAYTLQPGQAYYQVSTDATLGPAVVRPIGIQLETGYDLVPMEFRSLQQSDFWWWNRAGSVPRSWALVGTDAFVVYPQPTRALAVTVVGPAVLMPLTSTTQNLQIDDSLVYKLLDVAETSAYLKTRNFDFYKTAMARIQQDWPDLQLGQTSS